MAAQGGERQQRGGAVRSIILFLFGLIIVAGLAAAGAGWYGVREAKREGPLEAPAIVMVAPGMSVMRIARTLEEEGVVRSRWLIAGAARVKRVEGKIKAGEYEIPARASALDVLDLLVSGRSILHGFTAPEGRTTAQILRLLEANETLVGEITLTPGEGTLLPETYKFTRGMTRDGVIRLMAKAQTDLLDALWDDRALDLPYATREQAIILASIVEKETAVPAERGRIAAVFVNRLRRGMRLESDPTIIYGLTGGEPLGRGLRLSELRSETAYNTYVISGLPPTPIANPGRDSIIATLNPPDTDEIFFVADGTGGHAFAKTLDEHNRNVARWRRIEREAAAENGR